MEGMLDQNGRVIEDGPEPRPILPGDNRTFRVMLDCNQYRLDMDRAAQGKEVSFIVLNVWVGIWWNLYICIHAQRQSLEHRPGLEQ